METPAKFTFSPDGNTTVFQIPVRMKGDNYVRIDINNTTLNDRTKFDLVNNAVVFVSASDVPAGSKLDIFVVQTDEGIANLGAVNSIDIVATNIATVNTVGTNIAAVNTTAANIAAVNNVSNNMTAVTNAVASASSASSSASAASASAAAASASATAAAASATAAAASLDALDDTYLGAKAADPTVDNDGNPLKVGAQYFNSTNNELLIWNGSAWQGAGTIGGTVASLGVSGDLTIADRIVHSGDTNTAIRFPAADTVTVETSGAERLRVTSTGNVGIGTSSPAEPLHVVGTVRSDVSSTGDFNFTAVSTGGGQYRIYPDDATTANPTWLHQSNSSEDQAWVIGGVERMRIDSSGNVLQGTTSAITGAGGVVSVNQVAGTTAVSSRSAFVYSATNTAASVYEMGKSANATVGSHTLVDNGETLGTIRWSGSDGTNFIRAAEISGIVNGTPGTNDMPGALTFGTTADGGTAPTERMRIDSSGNVGIGTSIPAFTLHVVGQTRIVGASSSARLDLFGATSATDGAFSLNSTATRSFTIRDEYAAAERMRIDSSGNVGIGTTAPSEKLSVANNISATNLYVTSNGDTSTNGISGGFKHGGVSSKSLIIEADPNNVGAATYMGFNVDGSERLRINPSGAIGIQGANFGTSGQVLTSQGSAAAPVWANPAGGWTFSAVVRPTTSTNSITFTGIPADATEIVVQHFDVSGPSGSGGLYARVGSSAGAITSGYGSVSTQFAASTVTAAVNNTLFRLSNDNSPTAGSLYLTKNPNLYLSGYDAWLGRSQNAILSGSIAWQHQGSHYINTNLTIDRIIVGVYNNANFNSTSGGVRIGWK